MGAQIMGAQIMVLKKMGSQIMGAQILVLK